MSNFLIYLAFIGLLKIEFGCSQAIITAWKQCNGTTNGIINNVQKVSYSTNYVYTYATGIPDYTIGPWTGNPNTAKDQKFTFKFPRNPTKSSTKVATPISHIGQLINGVTIYNALDTFSYNNQGIWNRNAYYWEGISFDSCNGHPDGMSEYHHHANPKCLYTVSSSTHSALIGFAFDGYPIYGSYAYSNANSASSSITRMKTSYRLRSITNRQTLANGTTLLSSQYGPTINTTYPLGAYVEDYEYVSGSGDLDEFNGRYGVTPEYPSGTYAYFATIDASGTPEYPFLIGPNYYGTVETSNFGTSQVKVTVTESVTTQFTCSANNILLQTLKLNILIVLMNSIFYMSK